MAKQNKVNLREFQRDLAERLKLASAGRQGANRLGVESGGKLWLIPLADTGEVVPLPSLTTIPLTKPWYCGVTNIRGSLFSVVDFSAFNGGAPTRPGIQNRLVLFNQKFKLQSGLLVDRTLGLRRVDAMTPVSLAADAPKWLAAEWVDGNQTVWYELNMAVLGQDNEFLQVEQPLA